MRYSYIIPLYNEEESIPELFVSLQEIAEKLNPDYEVIFVDDGSTDKSTEKIAMLSRNDPKVKLISFRKNTGKSIALQTGFNEANGDIIITLDADLQDDPTQIPKLLTKINEGYDLVSGWKENRKDPLNRLILTKIFNAIVSSFSGLKLHDFNCGLKAYKKELVKELNIYGELHRFIPVIAHNLGFLVTEVPVAHKSRKYGKSKYGLARIPKGFLDFLTVLFLTNYVKRPLHLFGLIGALLLSAGFIFGLYLTYLRLMGETIGNRPLLFLTMLFIVSGFQFIFTGLLAEMILYLSPKYKIPIKQKLGFDE